MAQVVFVPDSGVPRPLAGTFEWGDRLCFEEIRYDPGAKIDRGGSTRTDGCHNRSVRHEQ